MRPLITTALEALLLGLRSFAWSATKGVVALYFGFLIAMLLR